jgi:hypothetical protein
MSVNLHLNQRMFCFNSLYDDNSNSSSLLKIGNNAITITLPDTLDEFEKLTDTNILQAKRLARFLKYDWFNKDKTKENIHPIHLATATDLIYYYSDILNHKINVNNIKAEIKSLRTRSSLQTNQQTSTRDFDKEYKILKNLVTDLKQNIEQLKSKITVERNALHDDIDIIVETKIKSEHYNMDRKIIFYIVVFYIISIFVNSLFLFR